MKPLSNPKSLQTIYLFSAATTHQLLDLHQEELLGPEGEEGRKEGRSVHIVAYSHSHHIQYKHSQVCSLLSNKHLPEPDHHFCPDKI